MSHSREGPGVHLAAGPKAFWGREVCSGPCQASCSQVCPKVSPSFGGPIGILAGILSPLSKADTPGYGLSAQRRGKNRGLEGTLLLLRDNQEEKTFDRSAGRKGPSSSPRRGVRASLTPVSQWPLPACMLVQEPYARPGSLFQGTSTIWFHRFLRLFSQLSDWRAWAFLSAQALWLSLSPCPQRVSRQSASRSSGDPGELEGPQVSCGRGLPHALG